jgi:hypothetical protein
MITSWVIPGVLSIVASAGVFLVTGYLDYENTLTRIKSDLREKALVAVRAGVHGARFFRFSRGPGPAFSGVDGVHLMSSA